LQRVGTSADAQWFEREIKEIDDFFYYLDKDKDAGQYAGMLERKRDDLVRCAVLQLHTAIEDVLSGQIAAVLLGTSYRDRKRGSQTKSRYVDELMQGGRAMGFDAKVTLALSLVLLNKTQGGKLRELNSMRNKCSHNWLLRVNVRKKKLPKAPKPPLLSFRGKDLHSIPVLKGFCGEFGVLHAMIWVKGLDR
jgi:hypothetical protein